MITIQQKANFNILVDRGDGNPYILSPSSPKKFTDLNVIKLLDHKTVEIDRWPPDQATLIDIDNNVTNVNGDLDLMFTTLCDTFFFRDVKPIDISKGWAGEVDTRNDLPVTVGVPDIGTVYLVKNPITSTVLGIPYRTYQSGLYIRDLDNGNLNDWRRLNVKVQFTDTEFKLHDVSDISKVFRFTATGLTPGSERTLTPQDKSYTLGDHADAIGSVTVHSDVSDPGSGQIITSQERTDISDTVTVHNDVDSAGSGDIITDQERLDINGSVTVHSDVSDSGSGEIITGQERTDINASIDVHNDVDLTTNAPVTDDILRFDGTNFIPDGLNKVTGPIISPPVLTADVDDYNPTGFTTANMIRQDTDNDHDITGMVAPPAGVNRIVIFSNISATGDRLGFAHNDVGSIPANRFLLRDDGDRQVRVNESAAFWYDHISQRWRPLNRIG